MKRTFNIRINPLYETENLQTDNSWPILPPARLNARCLRTPTWWIGDSEGIPVGLCASGYQVSPASQMLGHRPQVFPALFAALAYLSHSRKFEMPNVNKDRVHIRQSPDVRNFQKQPNHQYGTSPHLSSPFVGALRSVDVIYSFHELVHLDFLVVDLPKISGTH